MKLNNEILNKVCQPAVFDNPSRNLKTAHQLLKIMQKENGMGLAANQVGLDLRLFVMKVGDRYFHCFNPEIVSVSDRDVEIDEGCLSFPGQDCSITRPETIQVKYYSAHGQPHEETLSGWASRCFQHELDHLNGLTMFDRIKK